MSTEFCRDRMEVIYIADDDFPEGYGHEVWMEYLDWNIVITIAELDTSQPRDVDSIRVFKTDDGRDVTDSFFFSRDNGVKIRPTARNIYQVLDLLREIYDGKRRDA